MAVSIQASLQEEICGLLVDPCLWAWPLTDIEKFDVPVSACGQQGFWRWTP
jgi:hypothetical protein